MSTFKLPLKTFKTYRSWLGRCIVDRRLQRSTVVGPRVKLRWLWYVRWLIRNPETFGYWWTRLAWQAEPTDVSTYPYCFMVSLLSNAYEKIEETIVKTGSTMGFHKRASRKWSWRTYWMKKIQLTVLQVQWFHFKQPSNCIACCYGLITRNAFVGHSWSLKLLFSRNVHCKDVLEWWSMIGMLVLLFVLLFYTKVVS